MADPLPPPDSDAGALARLLLVETYAPSNPHYDRAESVKAMRLMRRVIENRLLSPARYGAAGATTDRDIVRMGNQFAGFRDYPILTGGLSAKLDSLLVLRDRGDERVAQFIADAVTVATEANAIPAYLQVTAWRTRNSTSPGADFHFVASLQGNDFYETSPVSASAASASCRRTLPPSSWRAHAVECHGLPGADIKRRTVSGGRPSAGAEA